MRKKLVKKLLAISTSIVCVLLLSVTSAFAHVIVTPHQVGVAATQDFVVHVPSEKDNPVISVRLLMPNGLSAVTPYVTPGWTITTKTSGSGDNAVISEIDWNNGSIPAGQAQELSFQAQVPAQATTLAWKAYQTYANGTVVSWNIDPATMKNISDAEQDKMADQQNKGVYSTTTVVNDLSGNNTGTTAANNSTNDQFANWLSVVALLLSISAFYFSYTRYKKK